MTFDFYGPERWGKETALRDFLEPRERLALKLIHSGEVKAQDLADLGCGDGLMLDALAKCLPMARAVGIEYSEALLKKARMGRPHLQFVQGDLSKSLPLECESLDLAYSGEVLEHLVNPDIYVQETFRILRPGGVAILTTPNLLAWYNRFLMLFGQSPIFAEYSTIDPKVGMGLLKPFVKSDLPVGHLRLYSKNSLRDLLAFHGFHKIKIWGSGFFYFPRMLRPVDQVISRAWPGGASDLIAYAEKPKLKTQKPKSGASQR